MKILIEAIEVNEGELTETQTAGIISKEATSGEKPAIAEVASKLDPGKTYVMRKHICRHDEHPIKPCIAEDISAAEIAEAVK